MDATAAALRTDTEGSTPSVLWKAFDVLRVFSQSRRVMTVSEIARKSGLPKSTAYRVLAMLVEVGAIDRLPNGYKVGIGMFSLGTMSVDTRYFDASFPVLQKLHAITGHTVHLATLCGDQVVYLNKLVGVRSPTTPAQIGGQLPAQITALGKALLAVRDPQSMLLTAADYAQRTTTFDQPEPLGQYLESIRGNGIAVEREEAAKGLSCIAAPIMVRGTAMAAVSLAFDASDDGMRSLVTTLRQAATAIGRSMQAVV